MNSLHVCTVCHDATNVTMHAYRCTSCVDVGDMSSNLVLDGHKHFEYFQR